MMERLEIVQEITGLPSMPEAARYAMAKGIESMNTQIQAVAMVKKLSSRFTPEELLPIFEKLEVKDD